MKTLTVAELIAALQKRPPGDKVSVWLPGSKIALSAVFPYQGETRIEGNLTPGSALYTEATFGRSPQEREQDRLDFEAMMEISQHGGKP